MPNAADYFARIAATQSPLSSDLDRLTTGLIGIHERKLARARQAELDKIQQAQEARAAQDAEDERQLKLLVFKKQLAADADRPGVERELAGPPAELSKPAPEGEPIAPLSPDTPDAELPPELVDPALRYTDRGPTPTHRLTLGGESLDIPLFDRGEIQARADEDFVRRLGQEKQLEETKDYMTVPEGFGELSGQRIPRTAFDALIRAQMGGIGENYTLGPGQVRFERGKEVARGPAERPATVGTTGDTGLSPIANRNLMGITTKFQADAVMAQANQGATIKAIADQVLANPASASNQLKALYILVKNLDPNSAVREGELQLAQAVQSYQQRFSNVLTRIDQGVVIDPQAAAQLATATKEIANLWDVAAQRRQKQYRAQAGVFGVGTQFDDYLSQFGSVGAESIAAGSGVGPTPQTKTVGGRTYRKVPGGWVPAQ